VAIVTSSKARPYEQARDAARAQLQKTGFSCTFYRLDEMDDDRLQKLRGQAPSAFLAVGSDAAAFLHQRFQGSVPLCYCMVSDPDSVGLTKGRPAAGVTTEVPLKNQIELVRRALPRAKTLGLLYRESTEKGRALKAEVQAVLPAGWKLEAVAVEKHRSFSSAVDVLLKRKVDLVWTWPDAALYNAAGVRTLLLDALRHGVPVYGFSRPFVRAGALLGMGVEPEAQGEQAATVLKSWLDKPQVPRKAEVHAPRANVILNLIVADRLSITLPDGVVREAAEVIRPR
jgi:putative ABC transport system substrate-binding protein